MQEMETRPSQEQEQWRRWATLDDDGYLCTLGDLSQRRTAAYRKRLAAEWRIAATLHETQPWPKRLIHLIVKFVGVEPSLAFLQQTLEIEAQGGMMLPDGTRRRTPGGVFFHLVKTQGPEEVKALGMWQSEQKPKKPKKAASLPTPKTAKTPKPKKEKAEKDRGTTVKITLIGRPASQIADKGSYVAFVMQSTKLPSLPKGVPSPAEVKTNYVVHMASKQWKGIAESLDDPEDVLIIEGYPQVNPKNGSISVYATNATSKNIQKAKRA